MRPQDVAELFGLAALWGAAFLFMRLGAGDFGPAALDFVRVAGAALVLLPLLVWRREGPALRRHWRDVAWVGLVSTALPFGLYTVAALALSAGLMAAAARLCRQRHGNRQAHPAGAGPMV